jgi:hypothetical protein
VETEIKRINFFDGLFLRQQEFLAEQLYHLHMRRRLNYILFDGSGVVQAEPGDLQITPTGGKNLLVTAGMAVSRRDDLRESREIILKNNSPAVDLSANGFAAGDQAFVAIHYVETPIEPQTVAAPNTPTRMEESAAVTLHKTWPPPALPDGENYILLGQVDFNSMTVNPALRQAARLRASLLGAVVSPPGAPTITTMTPNTGARSSSVPVQITGTNLTGAVVTCSDPNVTVSAPVVTATTINFTLAIGATANNCNIIVTTATAPPATSPFTVTTAVVTPVIVSLSLNQQASGGTVDVRGTNIRDTTLAPGVPATGTTIRLIGPGATKPALNITVRPDVGGNQVVRFTVPDRSGTTWVPKQAVTLELTFGASAPATTPFQYDD